LKFADFLKQSLSDTNQQFLDLLDPFVGWLGEDQEETESESSETEERQNSQSKDSPDYQSLGSNFAKEDQDKRQEESDYRINSCSSEDSLASHKSL
jgi:FtsZ-interacting cell division protein YlmF